MASVPPAVLPQPSPLLAGQVSREPSSRDADEHRTPLAPGFDIRVRGLDLGQWKASVDWGGEDAPGREVHQHFEHLASFGVDAGDHAVPGRAPRPGECAERAHEIGGHQKQAAADCQGRAAEVLRGTPRGTSD